MNPARGGAGLGLLILLAGCTRIVVPPEPPPPRIEPGPPPAVTRPTVSSTTIADGPIRSFPEVRALWVVRFTLTSERAVRDMVDDAAQAGINTLIVQVRGRADAFYRSEIEPLGESVRDEPGFDPLALTLELAHARGMAVHAWVNTHLVWGPTARPESPRHLVNANPEWLAVPRSLARDLAGVDPRDPRFVDRLLTDARRNSSRVEGIYTSPSHPSVRDRIHAVWLDLAARYDLDGIHFDYVRFPSADYDYSLGALERFRLWIQNAVPPARFAQLDAAYEADLMAFVDGEPTLWDDFRREQITRLVTRIRSDVKALKPRLVVSAAVIADTELAFSDRFQDWPRWLGDGLIDVAVPMAYTPDTARFANLIQDALGAALRRDRLWAGIGSYMTTPEGTMRMIDIARTEGAGGVVLFSYDWVVGEGRGDPERPYLRRVAEGRFGR